jgi:RNA polymerase sigma-70 factor (ECF subfamily)
LDFENIKFKSERNNMKIYYKISYLTNGTKVKITNQLFNQIKKWETEKVYINSKFLDELKRQDNDWINSTRRYYRHTVAVESLSIQVLNREKALRTNNFQDMSINKLLFEDVIKKLSRCTKTQRKRFFLYYYYGLSYSEIAQLEGRSKITVRESVKRAEQILINSKQ